VDLKGALQRSSFDEPDEPLSAIQKILNGVDRETFDAVSHEWMIRLQNILMETVNRLSYVLTELFNSVLEMIDIESYALMDSP
jgi:hypothetical protein